MDQTSSKSETHGEQVGENKDMLD